MPKNGQKLPKIAKNGQKMAKKFRYGLYSRHFLGFFSKKEPRHSEKRAKNRPAVNSTHTRDYAA